MTEPTPQHGGHAAPPIDTPGAPPRTGASIPPGYKQTEVGVIPEGWVVKPLGDITSIRNQKVMPENVDAATLCIELEHIGQGNGCLVGRSTARESTSLKYRFEAGDVLFGRLRSYLRKYWLANTDGICTTEIWPLVADPEKVESSFLFAVVQTGKFIETASVSYGTHMPRADWGVVRTFQTALPPLAEQRAIAEALSDVDALLESLDRLIAKKRDVKQGTMQRLLTGQTRLPGFDGAWEVRRLGEICDIAMGRTPSRLVPAYWGAGHTWLSISDLKDKEVSTSKEQITELAASTMTVVQKGTLLMSFKLSIGRLAFAGSDLYTNEAICSFNNLKANAEYLYYALGRTDFALYGKQAVKGYTLNQDSLNQIEVALPPPAEQRAIAAVLADMDAEIALLETRREKTRRLKQGMMQELLTGRRRLVES